MSNEQRNAAIKAVMGSDGWKWDDRLWQWYKGETLDPPRLATPDNKIAACVRWLFNHWRQAAKRGYPSETCQTPRAWSKVLYDHDQSDVDRLLAAVYECMEVEG